MLFWRRPHITANHGKSILPILIPLNSYCRLDRRLPHTDPFDRQILIGLGCFVEAFSIAAKQFGFVAQITAFPDGEPSQRLNSDRIATIKLTKTTPAKDPLFKQMLNRRSAKVEFDTQQPIKTNVLLQLTSLASVSATVDDSMINALNNLSYEALAKEMSIPHTLKESVDLMRIGKEEINQSPDGIDMSGAPMELMNKLGMLTREGMYEPKSVMNTSALDMFKAKFNTSMGYVWLTSENNSAYGTIARRQRILPTKPIGKPIRFGHSAIEPSAAGVSRNGNTL